MMCTRWPRALSTWHVRNENKRTTVMWIRVVSKTLSHLIETLSSFAITFIWVFNVSFSLPDIFSNETLLEFYDNLASSQSLIFQQKLNLIMNNILSQQYFPIKILVQANKKFSFNTSLLIFWPNISTATIDADNDANDNAHKICRASYHCLCTCVLFLIFVLY